MCVYVSVYLMCVNTCGGKKRVSDPPEQEVHAVVRHQT